MKIMLDTNILISALIFGGKARSVLIELFGTNHRIYVSAYVVREFEEKVHQKWPDKADRIMEMFSSLPVCFCESSQKLQGTLRDEKDIQVLSDALYHEINVLLTGDKDFLEEDLERPLIFSLSMMEEYLHKPSTR